MAAVPKRLGHYRLGFLMRAVGPMMIYEAYHEAVWVRRRVAVLPSSLGEPDPAAVYLESPYVVKVYEVGIDRGWAYAVSEWVPWPPLDSIIGDRRLTPSEAAALLHDILRALIDLERAGLKHRYLVPGLILVSPAGFLLDGVGLAHLLDGPEGPRALAGVTARALGEAPRWLAKPLQLAGEGRAREALKALRTMLRRGALERLARFIVTIADLKGNEAEALRREALSLLSRGTVTPMDVERLERKLYELLREYRK